MPSSQTDVYFDPFAPDLLADPYPMFRRLRDEQPLYYNPQHGFYAISRFDDVYGALSDHETYISGKGSFLELIKANIKMPPGMLLFEDPPIHDIHRRLLARMFTPRAINQLEPRIREFCARCLDPIVGNGRFDFVADLGAQVPMRTISMLLGIPEQDQEAIRDNVNERTRTEAGKPMDAGSEGLLTGEIFASYIGWRADHPSDDIMTDLLNVEFDDETGTTRRLTRDELLNYVNLVAAAGNETTTRLIGWAGKVLAEHPDQRRELAADSSLIPNAIDELLRFESPAPQFARYMSRDVEYHGQTVPAGSVLMMLIGAANRDHRRFPPDADVFDIHRSARGHLAFGLGIHHCLGAALARLEGRVALEEVLKRFPEWEIDLSNARLMPTLTVRGWETLPAFVCDS